MHSSLLDFTLIPVMFEVPHDVLSGGLNLQRPISLIDSETPQYFFEFKVPLTSYFLLTGSALVKVDPEDVWEAFVEVPNWQHRVSHQVVSRCELREVLRNLEVSLQFLFREEVFEVDLDFFFLQQLILNSVDELLVLQPIKSNSHFHLQDCLVTHIPRFPEHLQGELHGHLGVLLHQFETDISKRMVFFLQIVHDLLNSVWVETPLDEVLVSEHVHWLVVLVQHEVLDNLSLVFKVIREQLVFLVEVAVGGLAQSAVHIPHLPDVVEVGAGCA